ncbi:HAD hydrolase-like protein [Vibrio pelagius]|uniref:HAD hydrolase-like protein n=1 Tax=Vibrio pelagius TaxID=28169 RepID=A0ABY5G3R4_VIBPE|nr:HAD hydrolase-like protein [Vibrio pelagius]UTT84801.1 HAD hydrolase-like protein [Vibrio pelagius]
MTKTYLFDWGDTLMVNFPDQSGKMCDWPTVEPIDGALETLEYLSQYHQVYIATNAADSSEQDIQQAFSRVGLDKFIAGYFCKANLGVDKASPDFFPTIISRLNVPAPSVTMVGDTLEKDIVPALKSGINAIWFTQKPEQNLDGFQYDSITQLSELRR